VRPESSERMSLSPAEQLALTSPKLTRRTLMAAIGAGMMVPSAGFAVPPVRGVHKSRRVLIRNGLVANAEAVNQQDILIVNGRIEQIRNHISAGGGDLHVIDANGKQVLPGGIDPHVHLVAKDFARGPSVDPTSRFADDFDSGSKAALAGGITTIGVMSFVNKDETFPDMLRRYAQQAEMIGSVDVVLHGAVNRFAEPTLEKLEMILAAGQTTLKIFCQTPDFDCNSQKYQNLLRRSRELGVLPMFHCEDAVIMRAALGSLVTRGQADINHYGESRPVLAEEAAIQNVIALCEATGCPVYICHLSSAQGLATCEAARLRGLPVYVETRPIYLHLNAEKYATADAPLYVSAPQSDRPPIAMRFGTVLRRGRSRPLALTTRRFYGSKSSIQRMAWPTQFRGRATFKRCCRCCIRKASAKVA
jgi:dihydropyrimidinase